MGIKLNKYFYFDSLKTQLSSAMALLRVVGNAAHAHAMATPMHLRLPLPSNPLMSRVRFRQSPPPVLTLQKCRAKKGDDELSIQLERELQKIDESWAEFAEQDESFLSELLDIDLESSSAVETRRHYEIMFLVHEDFANDIEAVIEKVKGFIAEGKGLIWRQDNWGLRKLAYQIKKAKKAVYILMNIEIRAESINGLKSLLEKDERVIRYMAISQKEAITEESEPPPEYGSFSSDVDDSDGSEGEEGEEEEEEEGEEGEEEDSNVE